MTRFQATEVQKALKGAHLLDGGPQLAEIAQSNSADEELVDALHGDTGKAASARRKDLVE